MELNLENKEASPKTNIEKRKFKNPKGYERFFILMLALSILWIGGIILLNGNHTFTPIRMSFSKKIEFNIRHMLGKTPPMSSNLKILAIDDRAFKYLNAPIPKLPIWERLLRNIANKKPKVILIDKVFSQSAESKEDFQALEKLKKIDVPVYIGAIPIKGRNILYTKLTLDRDMYGIERFLDDSDMSKPLDKIIPPLDSRANETHAYGPDKDIVKAFRGFGHIIYYHKGTDKNGRVPPVIHFKKENLILPHLALHSASSIKFRDKNLYINNQKVPLNSQGLIDFNHRPPISFSKITKSLYFPLKRAEKGIPETQISEGDIVLIISFFTGGSDFHEGGPYGEIPGGFLIAMLIDSIISGNWINRLEVDILAIILMSILGLLVGFYSGPFLFWIVTTIIVFVAFTLSMYIFSFHGIVIPWFLPITSFLGSGIILYGYQSIKSEFNKIILRRNFFEEKARRLEEENKKIFLEESIALGKVAQDLLLPKRRSGTFQQFSFGSKYTPSQVMGGDWIYIWKVSDVEQRIILGDVMGKGPSAAIPMAVIISTMRDCEKNKLSLEESIIQVNRTLVDLFDAQITTTCAAIALHKSNKVEFYNAGSPGWFSTSKGKCDIHHLRSNPLGLSYTFSPAKKTIQIDTTTTLLTFTDGYIEGARAFRKLMRNLIEKEAYNKDIDFLHETLMKTGEGHRLVDDRSMLIIRAF